LSGTLVNALAAITLIEMVFTLGLGPTSSAVLDATKNWRLIIRALLASDVIVPAIAIAWGKLNPGFTLAVKKAA
jgi:predicted Na+-dependent transporter